MRVNVRHINVTAVKNNYNGKKTLQPLVEWLQQKIFSPFVYIFSILLVDIS